MADDEFASELELERDFGLIAQRPKLYGQCKDTYEGMEKASRPSEHGRIYMGALTGLIGDLGYNSGDYSRITKRLVQMGCITQLKRGAGGTPSVWKLNTEPSYEAYLMEKRAKPKRPANQLYELSSRITALELAVRRLQGSTIFGNERATVADDDNEDSKPNRDIDE